MCLSVSVSCVSGRRACACARACLLSVCCACVCFQLCASSPSVCAVKCLRKQSFFFFFSVFVFVFFVSSFCEVVAGVYSNENACISLSSFFSLRRGSDLMSRMMEQSGKRCQCECWKGKLSKWMRETRKTQS